METSREYHLRSAPNDIFINEEMSYFKESDEIVFLPFSCLGVKNIEKINDNLYNITLCYLEDYNQRKDKKDNLFSDFLNIKFEEIPESDVSKLILNSGIINEGLIDCPASMVDEIIMSRDKEVFGEKNLSLPFIIHYLADFYKQGKHGSHNYLNIKSELMNKFSGNSLDVKVEEAIAEIKRRANAVKAEMHNPMFEALIDKYVDAGLNVL